MLRKNVAVQVFSLLVFLLLPAVGLASLVPEEVAALMALKAACRSSTPGMELLSTWTPVSRDHISLAGLGGGLLTQRGCVLNEHFYTPMTPLIFCIYMFI